MDFLPQFLSPSFLPQISSNFSVLLSIPIGVCTGLISGLYGGIVVARYSAFDSLKKEALRVVRTIDYFSEGSGIRVSNHHDIVQLPLIASELLGDGHRETGRVVLDAFSRLNEIVESARHGKIGYSEFSDIMRDLQVNLRCAKPSWLRLLSPFFRRSSRSK